MLEISGSSRIDIGAVIWVSINPVIQLFLVGEAVGNYLARSGVLTPKATKMTSKLYVQVFTPGLLFAKILDSINLEAAKRMIIVVPFVLLYMILGLLAGFLCRKIFQKRLPDSFDYAILVAGAMSNWGDIPLAAVENITSGPPFVNGHKLIAHDFQYSDDKEDTDDIELGGGQNLGQNGSERYQPHITQHPTTADFEGNHRQEFIKRNKSRVFESLISLLTPVNISILAGLILGLTPAKSLFIKEEDNSFLVKGITPPLHVVYLTAKFLGAACVPVGLLNIGAAIVGLDMKSVPIGLNVTLALFKLVILPLIAIPLVYWCSHGLDITDKEERGLQLVLTFASCVPSATTTLILTQYYNPTGEAKHITAIFAVQYALGLLTMTLALGVISILLN